MGKTGEVITFLELGTFGSTSTKADVVSSSTCGYRLTTSTGSLPFKPST